jgi:hypothetical protein
VVLSPLRYESVPADRAAKIAHFIGTIPANGQVGFFDFCMEFSPIHSKWTKWTSKWTRFFEHSFILFFIFAGDKAKQLVRHTRMLLPSE